MQEISKNEFLRWKICAHTSGRMHLATFSQRLWLGPAFVPKMAALFFASKTWIFVLIILNTPPSSLMIYSGWD